MKVLKTAVGAVGFCAAISASATTYAPNFVWQRWADWTPGTVAGTSLGNADDDQAGTPVWRSGYLTGGTLSSSDPWFENVAQLAVWDDAWWGSSVGGVWARNYFGPDVDNDNANPPISRYVLYHDLSAHTHSYAYTSTVDWINPVGNGAILNISGNLTFGWEGHYTSASPIAPLEGVITRYDASSEEFVTLWSGSVNNPTAGFGLSALSTVSVPLTFLGIRFDQGDYLRVTFRADTPESSIPLWTSMQDSLYMRLVTVVPEASTTYLTGLGLLTVVAIGAKRRRAKDLGG